MRKLGDDTAVVMLVGIVRAMICEWRGAGGGRDRGGESDRVGGESGVRLFLIVGVGVGVGVAGAGGRFAVKPGVRLGADGEEIEQRDERDAEPRGRSGPDGRAGRSVVFSAWAVHERRHLSKRVKGRAGVVQVLGREAGAWRVARRGVVGFATTKNRGAKPAPTVSITERLVQRPRPTSSRYAANPAVLAEQTHVNVIAQ